ncbi:MAG: MYXO-CTERM sorting domain-containing protein [Polyangiaceae bacterium]
MRSISFSLCLVAVGLTACEPPRPVPTERESSSRAQDPIAYGTADSAHSAVVALLADAGGGSFSECSGTIVQMKNGEAYILTAAHCCNQGAPSIVVTGNDYSAGEQYLGTANPQPPAYPVIAGSVYYDSLYNQQNYDFCMLKASGLPANTPVIPVAQPGQDGLQVGVQVEHVGYGITDNNQNNSVRRHGTDTVDQGVTSLHIQYSQGGPSHIPGPCEGDSGGPALMPAGAAQSQQIVVATTSYGNSASCSQGSTGVSMRVTSETGPNGFITHFLADTPTGTPASSTPVDCNSCAGAAQSGACASQAQTCGNDPKCIQLNDCLNNCQTQACSNACVAAAGTTATNELNAFVACVCDTACVTECAAECGGSSTTSSTAATTGASMSVANAASSGGMNPTTDAATSGVGGAPSSVGGAGGAAGSTGASGDTDDGTTTITTCACRAGDSSPVDAAAGIAGLALVGLVVGRRRRR